MPSLSRLFYVVAQVGLRQLSLYALYRLALRSGYYRRLSARGARLPSRGESFPLFSVPSREALLRILGEEGKAKLLQEAEEILAGKFRMFGGEPTDIKLSGDWSPAHWTEFETGKIKLAGDIKFVWEPARFGWAFMLGRAYCAAGDARYAEAFWKYFETFTRENPFEIGPHWMNGQEVAVRLLALVWALHVFPLDEERKAALVQSVALHAARIPPTLIYARAQNNNHLVTESAALYSAGLLLNHKEWRALGWKWLNWAFQNQISEYGEYIQHSANYHRLTLQTALWVNLVKRDSFPHETLQALRRASHWLFSLLDGESGMTPNLGSNDGALLFPLSVSDFADYRPTVQACARAFLGTSLQSGAWDELALWMNSPAGGRVVSPEEYLTENLHGKDSWAYLRASQFKSRLAHMDQLHLDLWRRGLNVAQDAGTYLYNAAPPWDNPLVATRVHNVVMVDGADQMERVGRFLAVNWFNAYSKNVVELDENILCRVQAHYRAFHPFKHERTVTSYHDGRWEIRDLLTVYNRRQKVFRLHWLLTDGEWNIEDGEQGTTIEVKTPRGRFTLTVRAFSILQPSTRNVEPTTVSLVRAGEALFGRRDVQPYEGWVSRTYGQKSPALSFAAEFVSARDAEFWSEFRFED